MKGRIFRIDDFGASTKYYNQRGRKLILFKSIPILYFPFANWLFFKRIWPFKEWGKYDELTPEELTRIITLFNRFKVVPIFGVVACWVDSQNRLTPFPKKFPKQAKVLKDAYFQDKIIIANHGLTHCLPGKHLPRLFSSNRSFHREFWSWLPSHWHKTHILQSQKILESWLGKKVAIFVPPGNVWSKKTYTAIKMTNIKIVISKSYMQDSNERMKGVIFLNDEVSFNFHDRELKIYGERWLIRKLLEFIQLPHTRLGSIIRKNITK